MLTLCSNLGDSIAGIRATHTRWAIPQFADRDGRGWQPDGRLIVSPKPITISTHDARGARTPPPVWRAADVYRHHGSDGGVFLRDRR
jgi:hypothetical protein